MPKVLPPKAAKKSVVASARPVAAPEKVAALRTKLSKSAVKPAAAPAPKRAPKRAQEELRVSETGPGEWAWEMFRGGRFVARGENYSKKGNAARAAEKFNALLAAPMKVVA